MASKKSEIYKRDTVIGGIKKWRQQTESKKNKKIDYSFQQKKNTVPKFQMICSAC